MYTATKDKTVHSLDTAKEAKKGILSAANDAGQKVCNFLNSAGDEISHAKDSVATQIRTNPVQSTAVAFGVGFILGSLSAARN